MAKIKAPKLKNGHWDMLRRMRSGAWGTVTHGDGLGRARSLASMGYLRMRGFWGAKADFQITEMGLGALVLKER